MKYDTTTVVDNYYQEFANALEAAREISRSQVGDVDPADIIEVAGGMLDAALRSITASYRQDIRDATE